MSGYATHDQPPWGAGKMEHTTQEMQSPREFSDHTVLVTTIDALGHF